MGVEVRRGGLSGLSVFDRGIISIYSPRTRRFANKAAVVAGVATVGIVAYAFVREERKR